MNNRKTDAGGGQRNACCYEFHSCLRISDERKWPFGLSNPVAENGVRAAHARACAGSAVDHAGDAVGVGAPAISPTFR